MGKRILGIILSFLFFFGMLFINIPTAFAEDTQPAGIPQNSEEPQSTEPPKQSEEPSELIPEPTVEPASTTEQIIAPEADSSVIDLTGNGTVSEDGTYDIGIYGDGSTITISAGLAVTLTNTTNKVFSNMQIVCGEGVTLTIDGVKIDNSTYVNICPLSFSGINNHLILINESTFKSGQGQPGIKSETGTSIEISGQGSVEVVGGKYAAGIGSASRNSCGEVIISGGIINAKTLGSSGIGGGYMGSGGQIKIFGGTVTAIGGSDGAGIGSGDNSASNACNIYISAGTVNAHGGGSSPGIGSTGGTITIDGGMVIAEGGYNGAGIGSGSAGSPGTINISNGAITATGDHGAGIGSGYFGYSGTINISGGEITANGGWGGAGIGSTTGNVEGITITGGIIEASGGEYGAGIGAGEKGNSGAILISGGVVYAKQGYYGINDIGYGKDGSAGTLSLSEEAVIFLKSGVSIAPSTTSHSLHSLEKIVDSKAFGYIMPDSWGTPVYAYLNDNYMFSLIYDLNGGEGIVPDTVTQYKNTVTLIENGNGLVTGQLVFIGWNTQPDGSGDTFKPYDEFTFSENKTLYAIYREATTPDIISFPDTKLKQAIIDVGTDTNGDGDISGSEMAALTGLLNLSAKSITDLTGLEYARNISALNISNNYLDVSVASPDMLIINKFIYTSCDVTYLPQNKLTFTYQANTFGECAIKSEEVCYEQVIILPEVSVINEDYFTFIGWDIDGDGTKDYVAGQEFKCLSIDNIIFNAIYLLSEEANAVISFKDMNLEYSLRTAGVDLNGDRKITKAEMYIPKTLSLYNHSITNLDGLQFAYRVTQLLLDENVTSTIRSSTYTQYLDLSPLENLTQLTYLGLNINGIYDITPLQDLTNLTFLRLSENDIYDISPLRNLTKLQTLYLRENNIIDITPLLNLAALQTLSLKDNLLDINEGSADKDVINVLISRGASVDYLEQQYDMYYPVEFYDRDLADALLELGVDTNNNGTIEHIEMASITGALDLSEKGIIDLAGMEFAYGLKSLDVSGNNLISFSGISYLFNLDYLDISNNRIDPRKVNYKYDVYLDLMVRIFKSGGTTVVYDSQRTDVITFDDENLKDALINFGIKTNGYGQILIDGLYQYNKLRLMSSDISDLTGIEYARRTDGIILYDNNISDVTPLSGMYALRHLDLSKNNISDITPLAKLTNLVTLNLSDNPLDIYPGSEAFVVINSLISAGVNVIYDTEPNETILFADTELKAALISKGIDINNDGQITTTELSSVNGKLDLSLCHISDLSGLEYATCISALDLQKNAISDVTPLKYLTQLDNLNLEINYIDYNYNTKNETWKVLSLLRFDAGVECEWSSEDLINVDFNDTNLKNGLISIGMDYTGDNEISESELDSFSKIVLHNMSITDITGLEHADNLRHLDLSGNNISDIAPLYPIDIYLDVLILANNHITNISSLSMDVSSYLDISMNGLDISDGTVAKNRINYFIANKVGVTYRPQDISQQSETIGFPDPNLKAALIAAGVDIDSNDEITQGEMGVYRSELVLSNKNIRNITGLNYAKYVIKLNLDNNQIIDVSPLIGLNRLESLRLNDNQIEDFSPLAAIASLDSLYLQHNYINLSDPVQNAAKIQLQKNGTYFNMDNQYVRVTGVSIAQEKITIRKGIKQKINVTLFPENSPLNPNLIWSSEDNAIVTVDSNGYVTGVAKGKTIITVTTRDGGFADTCEVTVVQPVTSVTINKQASGMDIGDKLSLIADVQPADAAYPEITWSSSNNAIATVSTNGLVTAVKPGTAIITATADGQSGTCNITVRPVKVESVSIDRKPESLLIGGSLALNATVLPSDATYPTVTWYSSNTTIATVDQTGKVTAISTGEAVITASADGQTDSCKITVLTNQYTVISSANNSNYGFVSGGGTYENGASITLTAVPFMGYRFIHWTEGGKEVSKNPSYTFSVTRNASFTAEFVALTKLGISCSKRDVTVFDGTDGSVTIAASGGDSGAYQYSINGGASWQKSGIFNGLKAGTYSAAVRDEVYNNNISTCGVTVGQPSYMGSAPSNKISPSANTGTAISIVPPAAPNGYTQQSVTYSSSNPSVAAVDANGNVTFLAGGKVMIIIRTVSQTLDRKGNKITKTTTVKKTITVKQAVQSISLNLANTNITRTQKVKLVASLSPYTASNKKVTWRSSNPKVAVVSSSGVVTGKAGGTAIITCTARDGSGIFASCTVTVTPVYPASIKLSKSSLVLKMGKATALKATIGPKNTDFKTITWTSSNPAVVSVDAKGKIKAVSSGTAIVTVTTSNGLTASCTVTVQ